jgi:hypothetical protein
MLLLLPLFRGYPAYGRGDTLIHIGFIQDILDRGIAVDNGYPESHILVASLGLIGNIGIEPLVVALPSLFTLMYIVWMRNLAKRVFRNSGLIILVVALSFAVKFERIEQFSPFNSSLFLLPLFICILLMSNSSRPARIILATLVFAVTFTHVFFGVILTILILAFWISSRHSPPMVRGHSNSTAQPRFEDLGMKGVSFSRVTLLMSISFVCWGIVMYSYVVKDVLSWILYDSGGQSIAGSTFNYFEAANLNSSETTQLIWSRYGTVLFFYAMPIFLALISVGIRNKRSSTSFSSNHFLHAFMLFLVVTGVLFLSKDYFSYDRVFRIEVVLSIIISSFFIIEKLRSMRRQMRGFVTAFLIFLVAALLLTTVFTLHRSPITYQQNSQVTRMEIEGAHWLFENTDGTKPMDIAFNTYEPRRLGIMINGFTAFSKVDINEEMIPDEFGYEDNETIAKSLELHPGQNEIMVFTRMDILNHLILPERFSGIARTYSQGSISELANDRTANIVFSNGDVTMWIVYG